MTRTNTGFELRRVNHLALVCGDMRRTVDVLPAGLERSTRVVA